MFGAMGTTLKGRRALVTGAAAGLGKAYAIALAQAGADVAICDVNDSVKAVRDEIRGTLRSSCRLTMPGLHQLGCGFEETRQAQT